MKYAGLFIPLLLFLLPFSAAPQGTRGLDVVARAVTGDPNFDAGRQYAVVIGIDRYKEWPGLRSAVSEAKAVRQVLADRYVIDKFFELYDDQATASNIRRLFIETLPAQIGLKDSLLVFYAGHGQTDATGTGFWIASDGSRDQLLQNNWLPNQQLRNMIGSLKAQRILILADACFSGDFLNVQRGANPTIDSAYFRQALQLTARQALTSGSSQSVPDDSEFGHQLVDLLERNDQGLLDPVTMYERIRLGVTKTLPLLGTMPGNQEGSSFVLFLKSALAAGGGSSTGSGASFTAPGSGSGDLMVKADQAGAEILVDGISYGKAPALVKKLGAGVSHTIVARTATMSGSLDLTIAPGDVKEVSLSLQAFTGNIYVVLAKGSAPDAGPVHLLLDGADKGELGSGIFKGIPVGAHKLEFQGKDTYGSAAVTVAQSDTAQVSALLRPVGTVAIDAPADTPIVVSGPDWRIERSGGGTVPQVPAGPVVLSAGGSGGWAAASQAATMVRGQTLSWKPWTGGSLTFKGADGEVLVSIDGGPEVQAQGAIDGVAPGSRSLLFKKPGFRDQATSVSVSLGKATQVPVKLDRLEPAKVSFDDFGIALAIDAPRDLASRAGSASWTVASGIPVSLRFSSLYAERIDASVENATFSEGESRKLELPSGRIALPWLRPGDRVRIGTSATIELANQASEGFSSRLLPAGAYRIAVGSKYTGTVTVTAGGLAEPPDYRSALSSSLSTERSSLQKSIASKRAKISAGWISLAAGIVGAAGTGVVYYLGGHAMDSYRATATTASAADSYKSVQLYQALFPIAAGIGGLGLGLSPFLLSGGPDPKGFQKSIDELDAGIKALAQ